MKKQKVVMAPSDGQIYLEEDDTHSSRWPLGHFKPDELRCKGTGILKINLAAGLLLEELRELHGGPIHVVSAYRSPSHNRAVGGAVNSFHLKGRAFDLQLAHGSKGRDLIQSVFRQNKFGGVGFYPTFIHVDTGPARFWVG